MENENKDWKPEVGKTAWYIAGGKIVQGMILEQGKFLGESFQFEGNGFKTFIFTEYLFPTAEAARASIKVFDLEGKEVVVTRDWPVHVTALCPSCSKEVDLGDDDKDSLQRLANVASKMEFPSNPEGAARLKAAQDRFASLAAGNEDPCDPSAREITTPTDKRNGDHC